jgi:hypothetical protein
MADFRDRVAKGVADIAQDIRHRWEEFAWGRIVTPRAPNTTIDTAGEQSLAERYGWSVPGERTDRTSDKGWAKNQPKPEHAEGSVLDMFYHRLSPAERAEHFREPPEQDRGIER